MIGRGWQEKGGVASRKGGLRVPRFRGGWPQEPGPLAWLNTRPGAAVQRIVTTGQGAFMMMYWAVEPKSSLPTFDLR